MKTTTTKIPTTHQMRETQIIKTDFIDECWRPKTPDKDIIEIRLAYAAIFILLVIAMLWSKYF